MSKKDIEQQVQQALQTLGLENTDWKRHVSASDILYLLDQCPFLQIMDTALPVSPEIKPLVLVTAKSNWKIHDYGNAISSSPGELLFGPLGKPRKKWEDDEEGGEGGSGSGTMVNQAVITAFEMIELAKQHGWAGVQIVDGHPLMAWAAWMQAFDSEITLEGFNPTAQDFSKRRRLKQSAAQTLSQRPSLS